MSKKLALLTRAAVLAALDEFIQQGRTKFLERYGFGRARDYFVRHPATGTLCDSKAIVGAAYGHQFPAEGPLKPADFSGGEATVATLLTTLGFNIEGAAGDWSRHEVELIVSDYLQMLTLELTGQSYNKTARRRALLDRLNARSEGSIEFKHANISAVMVELGFPYLRGYKPRFHFQRDVLTEVVASQVQRYPLLDDAAMSAVERPALEPEPLDFSRVKAPAPPRQHRAAEPTPTYSAPVKRDYLEREARNRSLGAAGEKFVLQYERWRLIELGVGQLADKVQHVSETQGDGLGYDVLSFEPDGRERFVEVKTTAFGETTPFFVSSNEVRFARAQNEQFRLYRLFDFRSAPRFFELAGAIEQHCHLDPATYRAALN